MSSSFDFALRAVPRACAFVLCVLAAGCGGSGGGGGGSAMAPLSSAAPAAAAQAPAADAAGSLAPSAPASATPSTVADSTTAPVDSSDAAPQVRSIAYAQATVQDAANASTPLAAARPLDLFFHFEHPPAFIVRAEVTSPDGSPSASVPVVPATPSDPAGAYRATVPAEAVVPGMQFTIRSGPAYVQLTPPIADRSKSLLVVLVPVQIGDAVGRIDEQASAELTARLPVGKVEAMTHPVFASRLVPRMPSTAKDWELAMQAIAQEMLSLRVSDGLAADTHVSYVAFVPHDRPVASWTVAFGNSSAVPDSEDPALLRKELVHAIGHQLLLADVPCDAAPYPHDVDRQYPYPNGALGDAAHATKIYLSDSHRTIDPLDPSQHDAMSACAGDAFSDYSTAKLRAAFEPGGVLGDEGMDAPQLLVTGVSDGRSLVLMPPRGAAQVLPGPAGAAYELRTVTRDGRASRQAFGAHKGPGGWESFSFTIPNAKDLAGVEIWRDGVLLANRPLAF